MMSRHQVVVIFVREAANDGVFIRQLCQLRHMLTHLVAWSFCLNWVELATYFRGRIRFHIQRIVVAHGSSRPYQNHFFAA